MDTYTYILPVTELKYRFIYLLPLSSRNVLTESMSLYQSNFPKKLKELGSRSLHGVCRHESDDGVTWSLNQPQEPQSKVPDVPLPKDVASEIKKIQGKITAAARSLKTRKRKVQEDLDALSAKLEKFGVSSLANKEENDHDRPSTSGTRRAAEDFTAKRARRGCGGDGGSSEPGASSEHQEEQVSADAAGRPSRSRTRMAAMSIKRRILTASRRRAAANTPTNYNMPTETVIIRIGGRPPSPPSHPTRSFLAGNNAHSFQGTLQFL